jgi:signal transduction histidine kinase
MFRRLKSAILLGDEQELTTRPAVKLFAAIALLFPMFSSAQSMKQVLVLHTYNANMTANKLWSEAFHETFDSDVGVQLYEEYFDDDRFPETEDVLTKRLRDKYAGKKINLVVSLGRIPLNFVIRHSNELWPGALKVTTAAEIRVLNGKLPPDIAGVFGTIDFGATLDLALQLAPNTRHVFYLGGVDPAEEIWHHLAEQDFKRFADRVDITYLNDLSFPEQLERLSRLPDYSVVFYQGLFRDAAGHTYMPERVCPLIVSASNSPVYGTGGTLVGCGIVGGVVVNTKGLAEETAKLARRVLERGTVAGFPIERMPPNRAVVDWRQLQRWRMSENRLPSGTIVRFRTPSAWEQYKWYVLAGLAAIVAQFALIIALVVEMRRRKTSDLAIKNLSGRLINAGEEERKRIARELHDDIGQRLSLLSIELDGLGRDLPTNRGAEREALSHSLQQINELVTDVHNLSHQLHSSKLQMLGLPVALRDVCRQVGSQHEIEIELAADDIPSHLPEDLALCFYRVAQEALNNSVKHSAATRAEVRVAACDGTLKMTIKDDGTGFDPAVAARGLGLATMRERLRLVGGDLVVSSKLGEGTEVTAQAKLNPPLSQTAAA